VLSFLRLVGAPMLQTSKGTVSLLPVDYLIWTPLLAELAADASRDRGGKGPADSGLGAGRAELQRPN